MRVFVLTTYIRLPFLSNFRYLVRIIGKNKIITLANLLSFLMLLVFSNLQSSGKKRMSEASGIVE